MNTAPENSVVARLIESSYLEIIPVAGIEERLLDLPVGAYVAITCSPTKGVEPTLQLTERLADRNLKLIPHIAARTVRDRSHLQEILQRLGAARIRSVFIPGGDAKQPLGSYTESLQLLRDMAEIGHELEDIGVAAHPEGHQFVSDAGLLDLLLEKQAFANYMVTQMCFDPDALITWLSRMREAGCTLPAWIGLPGVADRSRLFNLSMRIGVGPSVKMLLKQKGLLNRMVSLKPYQPDDLLDGLAPYLGDPGLNIPGFHLYSFNDIQRTERWREEVLVRYKSLSEKIA